MFEGKQRTVFFLQTLYFTAFIATVEKIITYALGEHDPGSAQDWRTSNDFCSPACRNWRVFLKGDKFGCREDMTDSRYLGMIAALCQLLLSLVHMVHWRRPCSVVTCASAKSVLRMGAAQSRVRAVYNGWQRRAPNFVRNNVRNNSIRPPCKLQNSGLKSNFFTFQMQAFI